MFLECEVQVVFELIGLDLESGELSGFIYIISIVVKYSNILYDII